MCFAEHFEFKVFRLESTQKPAGPKMSADHN